jgi:hypothetical protein
MANWLLHGAAKADQVEGALLAQPNGYTEPLLHAYRARAKAVGGGAATGVAKLRCHGACIGS